MPCERSISLLAKTDPSPPLLLPYCLARSAREGGPAKTRTRQRRRRRRLWQRLRLLYQAQLGQLFIGQAYRSYLHRTCHTGRSYRFYIVAHTLYLVAQDRSYRSVVPVLTCVHLRIRIHAARATGTQEIESERYRDHDVELFCSTPRVPWRQQPARPRIKVL